MHTRAIPIVLALMLYGCGDSGRREGGDDGSTGGDDDETSGLPGIADDTDGQDDADADGSGPIGDGAASSSGGEPVDDGVSCEQIWDCYEGCEDTDCTVACYEEGSTQAQEKDDALWECIFVNQCGIIDWDCVGAHCAAEQQACFQ